MSGKLKTFIIVLSTIICSGAITAFALNDYWTRQPLDIDSPTWSSYREKVNNTKITDANSDLNDMIPTYWEEELLFKTGGVFDLGRDAGVYANLNCMPNSTGAILTAYPTNAIREQENNTIYFLYDTDTGYRLYLFFKQDGEDLYLQGYPIVIGKLLSYEDFSEIRPGDPISEVERIDPVAGLHEKQLTEVWKIDYKGAKYKAEHGSPCVSVHYLKDGILVFKYDMTESGDFIISQIDYHDDYVVPDVLGEKVCYKINEIDLPGQK